MPEFELEDAVLVGISADSVKSHERFAEKNGIRTLLLSDPEKGVLRSYGAWGEKKMYGKIVEGIVRSTFLIDPEGTVRWTWIPVKVPGHAEDVLETLRGVKKEIPKQSEGGK